MKKAVPLLLMLLAAGVARASLVTVVATGALTEFSDSQGLLPFSAEDAAGGFTLTFTYRDDTADGYPADADLGFYVMAITAAQLTVGTVPVKPGAGTIIILNNDVPPEQSTSGFPFDLWYAAMQEVVYDSGRERLGSIDLSLLHFADELPVAPFESDALAIPPWPYPWGVASIVYRIEENDVRIASVEARIRALSVEASEVPLPAAVVLLPTVIGAVMLRTRRRVAR